MHWQLPVYAGLTALLGLAGALPAYGDGLQPQDGYAALGSNWNLPKPGNATLTEHNAHLSARDTPPFDWRSWTCDWWPRRTPGSILGNEGNGKLHLVSDCSRVLGTLGDRYTIRTNVAPELVYKTCACDYFHFFLRQKAMSLVSYQRPICVPWNDGKGVEIVVEAYKGRAGSMNWALEMLYGFKSTCRVGEPKADLGV